MRVVLIIYSLSAGGAERVLTGLANHWADRGWGVTLLTLVGAEKDPFYPLHPGVTWQPLGVAGTSESTLAALGNNRRRVQALRQAIVAAEAQVVVSFMLTANVLTLLAARGLDVPVVISERIDPAQFPAGAPWRVLRRLLYPRARRLVVLTDSARAFFPESVRRKTCVIPISVHPPAPDSATENDTATPRPRLLAMGRLVPQKGFDLLLEAFARVAPSFPEWTLHLYGEGEQRQALTAQLRRLQLADRVTLHGVTAHPQTEMRRSDLFVMSSRYEGFGNVLCEAMACGLPVVSFDCPSGPGVSVRHGVDGLLVPPGDVAELADALGTLMADPEERRRLASRAPEILERFSHERVMHLWDRALEEARR